ncbi:MAG TPA: HipA domain-containing protein [Mycobacteriales bacterium]|nr:HipA domain-containing protein [Mycobacteriales bacterium]
MTAIQVHVAIDGQDVLAGTLYASRRRNTESAAFAYESSFLAHPGAYALDPLLPLTRGTHQTRAGLALFGGFSDCAPDRWGRTLMKRREAALARAEGRAARSLGEIEFLLGVRDDLRQGALRFRKEDGPFLADTDTGVPALTDLPSLLDLAERAERDTADLPDLQRLVHVGSSLGGARPKAHVLGANGRVAIAKFPSANDSTWTVTAWEKVALDLAASAGITVPESRLLNLAGRHVLVVDRFDRTADGRRIGYSSAMTMLEASDGDQRSYLEIADVLERVSTRATAELHQLWRRIVFSVLISNTDDHLRNHGFLHERGDSWRLSPAFDLNPNPDPGPKYLSTAIDDGYDAASVEVALGVAELLRLAPTDARNVLAEVVNAVRQWRTIAAGHGLSASEIGRMQPAFVALDEVAV